MKETGKRTMVKIVSYRFLGEAVTFLVAYGVTGKFRYAASITAIESLIKLGTYAAHERLWDRISLGRADPTEPVRVDSPIKLQEPTRPHLPVQAQTGRGY